MTVVALLLVAGTLVLFNNSRYNAGAQEEETVKIGANLALTSTYPLWSKQVQDGLALAIEEFNARNPQQKVALIVEDNQGKPNLAVAAFQKLVSVDQVSVVLSTHTPLSQPLQATAASEKIPLLGTVVSAVGFGEANEWSFLDWPTHTDLTPPVAEYSFDVLSARRAATLVVNDDYGLDGARLFAKTFSEKGGTVELQETFTNQDTDLRDQLSRILDKGSDTIYTVGREQQLIAVVRQAREMGFKGNFVGVNAFDAPSVWSTLGPAAEGIVFAGVGAAETSKERSEQFEKTFEKRYARKPDWIALYGYSIGEYLAPIVSETKGNRDQVRTRLATLRAETLRGQTLMPPSRAIKMPVVVFKRQQGQNIPVK